ncbi:tellurite resistance TerB family protein [Rufibacter roseus]|uniref:TerB family tellurite resistance protein n=1 Tax=Rufibacter roseus TaxID=1567108 RepID=A0ABW2DI66_9BACT|nr:TerB family tellurite resistance protein [Rufibacter roseus]
MAEETTLLKDYTNEEKGAYLGALATIASADGHVSDEELQFLQLMAEASELPENVHHEIVSIARNPSQISLQRCLDVLKGSNLRFSFITDIISFAKADGEYSPEEQKSIAEMGQYLGIDQKQFSILDQFVDKANEAQKQGEDPTSKSFMDKSGFGSMFQNAGISPGMVTGMLGVLAPIVIGGMMSRRRGYGYGGGRMGGLGSMASILGGLGGRSRYGSMRSGGLGGLLGGILGGGRRGGSMW